MRGLCPLLDQKTSIVGLLYGWLGSANESHTHVREGGYQKLCKPRSVSGAGIGILCNQQLLQAGPSQLLEGVRELFSCYEEMFKYLAKDYLIEACQQRRAQTERMLVPPPNHIEFVEDYVHKGGTQRGDTHLAPWLSVEELSVCHQLPHMSSISCADSTIRADLSSLVKASPLTCGDGDREGRELEDYGETHSERDRSDDFCFLSQDIASAMERYVEPSWLPSLLCEDSLPASEEASERFCPAKLLHGELLVDEGYNSYLLEEPESPLHLEGLLQLMPTVNDLVACLKPKMIQDPFLDSQGQPYCYARLCRSDLHYVSADETIGKDHSHTYPTCGYVGEGVYCEETFQWEEVADIDGAEDLLLELVVEEEEKKEEDLPSRDIVADAELVIMMSPPSGSEMDSSDNQKAVIIELQQLVGQCRRSTDQSQDGVEDVPNFSPEKTERAISFAELNDEGHISTDSGIGYGLLESPCIPLPLSPLTSTPLLRDHLRTLDPIPVSPETADICILSPVSMKKQVRLLWEQEKVFDSILALTLPCPDASDGIEDFTPPTVKEVVKELELETITFDGNDELELCWDPLEASYGDMLAASKTLLLHEPVFEKEAPTDSIIPDSGETWEEVFVGEPRRAEEEAMLSPVLFGKEEAVSEYPLQGDVPHLVLEPGTPVGYMSAHHRHSPPTCNPPANQDPDAWRLIQRASSTYRNYDAEMRRSLQSFRVSPSCGRNTNQEVGLDPMMGNLEDLDAFMMLRSGITGARMTGKKRARLPSDEAMEKRQALSDNGDDAVLELEFTEKITTPVFKDICLSGSYLSALSKMETYAVSLKTQLEERGLHVPVGGTWPREPALETLKFLFKQQQKALQDCGDSSQAGDSLKKCQLAVCLYVACSVMDTFTHCSLRTALDRFSVLSEKYSELIDKKIYPLKECLVELESCEALPLHPKLAELVRVVDHWRRVKRRSCRDKAVVVVAREFPVLSGEILDYFQSIPSLESCVFSFLSDGPSALYKTAIGERFQHYDCLVVPTSAVSDHSNFHWEKVSLLVEYEPLKKPLFGDSCTLNSSHAERSVTGDVSGTNLVLDRLNLQDYFTLRTVLDLTTSCLSLSSGDGLTYTVVASENVTRHASLLQLLETRYNVLVVERDYSILASSKWLSWADLAISQGVGILIRPLSSLSSESSARRVIGTVTMLSLQYHTCWVILYQQNQERYELGGCVPYQLSLLHAAVAPLQYRYNTQILTASSVPRTAQLVRKIMEETHITSAEGNSADEWTNRSWLCEEFTEKEKFLLSFPCINSFSAQYMLQTFSLAELLDADLLTLTSSFPSMPTRTLEMFHSMCHTGDAVGVPTAGCSPNIPTSTDTASSTPPISSSKSSLLECEDHFRFRVHGDDNIPTTGVHQLSPVSGGSWYRNGGDDAITIDATFSHAGFRREGDLQEDCLSSRNAVIMPSRVPGLDDSLDNSDPGDSSVLERESVECSKHQSFFHEDLECWMEPTCERAQLASHEDQRAQLASHEDHTATSVKDFSQNSTTMQGGFRVGLFSNSQSKPAPDPRQGIPEIPYRSNSPLDVSRRLAHDLSYVNSQSSETCVLNSNPNICRPVMSHFPLDGPNWEAGVVSCESRNAASGFSMVSAQTQDPVRYLFDSTPNTSRPMASCFSMLNAHNSETTASSVVSKYSMHGLEMLSDSCRSDDAVRVDMPSVSSMLSQHFPHIRCPPGSTLGITSLPSSSLQNAMGTAAIDCQRTSVSCPPVAALIGPSRSSMADNCLIPRSSKIIASSTVRKPFNLSAMERAPIKALDLGLTEKKSREPRLQSNDRSIVAHEPTRPASDPLHHHIMLLPGVRARSSVGHGGEVVRSKYFISPAASSLGSSSGRVISSSNVGILSDLKTFHQREGEALSRGTLRTTAPDWMKSGATVTTAPPLPIPGAQRCVRSLDGLAVASADSSHVQPTLKQGPSRRPRPDSSLADEARPFW